MEFLSSATAFVTSATFGFVLKLSAGVSAAAFGILGLGAKARDDKGQITRQGWVALGGIVTSLLIGAASATYDFVKGQHAAAVERAKSQHLLLAAERGIYPLRGITATALIEIPSTIPGLPQYVPCTSAPFAGPIRRRL